jgi:hypothetical protein
MSYKVTRANEAYKYDAAGHYDVQKTGDRKQGTPENRGHNLYFLFFRIYCC